MCSQICCVASMQRFLMQWRVVELVRNLMAQAQKPHFVFLLNGRVHLNRRRSQFSRMLAVEVWALALVMLDTLRSEVVWEYWLPTQFASFPFTSPPVRHSVPPHSESSIHHRGVSFVQTYFNLHVLKKRRTCDIIMFHPLSLPPFISCKVETSCERHVSSYHHNVGLNFLLSVTPTWPVLLWYERKTSAPFCRTVEWDMAMCLQLLRLIF